jgi:hypothetical protein
MSTDPEQIRQDIERTQTEMSGDVDALTDRASMMADKYNPRKAAGRQAGRMRDAFHNTRDKVMGSASSAAQKTSGAAGQARERASHTAQDAKQAISSVPDKARDRTEGSPLAVGLIAFGAGLLAGSLLPASEAERLAGGRVKDMASQHSDQLKQGLRGAGQQMREGLRGPAQQAAESVKSTAGHAASQVRDEGQGAARDVKEQTQQAGQNVRSQQR